MLPKILLKKALIFKKRAGILTVPPALLKQVEDWAVGCYCYHLLKKFDEVILNQNSRIRKLETAKFQLNDFNEGMIAIDYFISSDDIDIGFNVFKSWAEKSQFHTIPFFNKLEDVETGLQGIINNLDYVVKLAFVDLGDNLYNFSLKFPNWGTTISEKQITKEELKKILQNNYDDIEAIYARFKDFLYYDNYDTYDKLSMRDLHLKKFIYKQLNFNEGKGYRLSQAMTFPINQIPYFKDLKLPVENIGFRAEFLTGNQKSSYNVSEDWIGLFSPQDISLDDLKDLVHLDTLPIGTIAIYRDIEADFENGLEEISINQAIQNVKKTARHETQHLLQWAFKYLKNLKEQGGLPSKKIRDKNTDIHGRPQDITGTKNERIEHGLRDIEFYTRLQDTVSEFNNVKTNLPLSMHHVFAKAWIGEISPEEFSKLFHEFIKENGLNTAQSLDFSIAFSVLKNHGGRKFFQNLKEKQPLKYQKAVKEFYKAINI